MPGPYDGRAISWLGQGLAAARPATPTIDPKGLAFWYSTDTGELDLYDFNSSSWVIVIAGGGGGGVISVNSLVGALTLTSTLFNVASSGTNIDIEPLTSATATETTQAVSTYYGGTNVKLLSSNANRVGGTVYNKSTQPMYIGTSSSVSLTLFSDILAPGDEWDIPDYYTGEVWATWYAADATGQANMAAYPS